MSGRIDPFFVKAKVPRKQLQGHYKGNREAQGRNMVLTSYSIVATTNSDDNDSVLALAN